MPNSVPALRAGLFLLASALVLLLPGRGEAQYVSLELSTLRDQNIFDSYAPFPDRITQLQLGASTDWDFDYSNLSLSYYGTLLVFRDLPERTYHVHIVSLNSLFHIEREDEEEEEEEAAADSTASDDEETADEDSVGVAPPPPAPPPAAASAVHNDSLDRYLALGATASSQFDRAGFSQYDNLKLGASADWREPLGPSASLRASYGLRYHSYPNLAGISNVENRLALLGCFAGDPAGWYVVALSYGMKAYTTTAIYSYEVGGGQGSGNPGHGKGGGGSGGSAAARTRTIALDSPPVRQLVLGAEAQRRLTPFLRGRLLYQHFATPSTTARILPQQIDPTAVQQGLVGLAASQNEVFDDHYGYSGSEGLVGVDVALPFSFALGGAADYIEKTYTIPAMDLQDSLVVAAHRRDFRLDASVSLARPIVLGAGKSLTPKAEAHFVRNHSNAPYYEFDKQTFLVGVEYSF